MVSGNWVLLGPWRAVVVRKVMQIRLSSEGSWYHDGVEVTHERTVDLFFKSLIFCDGRYYLTGEKEPVPVDIEDTAYFICGLDKSRDGYTVTVSDGTSEPLALSSLDTGAENQLYCQIHGKTHQAKAHRAKFVRKVYYELMKALVERDGYYGLNVSGIFYPIQAKEISPQTLQNQTQPTKNKKVKKVAKSKKKIGKTKAKKPTKKSVKKNARATRKKSQSKKRR